MKTKKVKKQVKRVMQTVSVDSLTICTYKCGTCGRQFSVSLYDMQEDQMWGPDCEDKNCEGTAELISITGEKA